MFDLSNKTYDFLSKLQRWLPSIGVAYLSLCRVWGTPFGDQVNETIAIIATLLASYLEVSTAKYNKTLMISGEEIFREDEPNEDEVDHKKEEGTG